MRGGAPHKFNEMIVLLGRSSITRDIAEIFGTDYLVPKIKDPKNANVDPNALAEKMLQVAVSKVTSTIKPLTEDDIIIRYKSIDSMLL